MAAGVSLTNQELQLEVVTVGQLAVKGHDDGEGLPATDHQVSDVVGGRVVLRLVHRLTHVDSHHLQSPCGGGAKHADVSIIDGTFADAGNRSRPHLWAALLWAWPGRKARTLESPGCRLPAGWTLAAADKKHSITELMRSRR